MVGERAPEMIDPLYVVARAVLLDALEAIGEQRNAVVLVGAQAIYLHTGDTDIAVPAFTRTQMVIGATERLEDPAEMARACELLTTELLNALRI